MNRAQSKRRAQNSLIFIVATVALLCAAPAISRAQNLYVANYYNTVSEYNATTGATINASFIKGTGSPVALAISGANLYVVGVNSNEVVGEYNATTGESVNANFITGLNSATCIAISGSSLYVVSYVAGGSYKVSEYNATTGDVINASLITGLDDSLGIAVSGSIIYVGDYIKGTVGEYNSTTGKTINASFISGLGRTEAVAVSGSNLYVTNNGSTVREYSATTGATLNGFSLIGVDTLSSIVISGNNLYVANYYSNTVGEYDATTGATINALFINNGGNNFPLAIAVSPPPPTISSTLGATGTDGFAFHYQIEASNNAFGFNATGLPRGLSVNKLTGLISGKPSVSGTFISDIEATNAGGTGSDSLTLTILPTPPAITSHLKAIATNSLAFNYQITATNDPTGFNATGLPSGLTVGTSTGLISGTAITNGSYAVTISAANAGGTGSSILALTVDYNGVNGTYTGIGAVGGTNSGLFNLLLTPTGKFTGKLTLAGAHYPFEGTFLSSGSYNGTLSAGAATLDLALTLDPSVPDVTGNVTVTTTSGSSSYSVEGSLLGSFKASTLPVGLAGRYTLVMPPLDATDPNLPSAPGYGTMTVTTKGAIMIAGKLGDGTPFTAGGALNADGRTWTLFEPLYAGKNPGSIIGTMTFESETDSDCDGTLSWVKPPQTSGSYYPNGFSVSADLQAAKYASPPLTSDTASFIIGGGDLPDSAIADNLSISSRSKVTVSGTNDGSVTVTLTPSTGAFSGNFRYPGTNEKTSFSGVIFQKPVPTGFGLFLGKDQSGSVDIDR